MKNVKLIVLAVLTVALFSCSVSTMQDSIESAATLQDFESVTATASENVQLVEADIVVTNHPAPYTMVTTLVGEIKVKNLAFDKNVIVHVETVGAPMIEGITTSGWFDVTAEYSHSIADDFEIWTFEVPTELYKGGQGSNPLFEYVIKYEVNGSVYWDNNHGSNYWDDFVRLTEVQLVEAEYFTSSNPLLYTMNHHLEGKIEVQNISYNKEVTVVYKSKDGNWKEMGCYYIGPSVNGGNEYWTFSIEEDVYLTPPDDFYRFAIKYVVDGTEYWDNNDGIDYHIDQL